MPTTARFLLVDDSPASLFLQQRLLERLKAASSIATANNGSTALAKLPPQAPSTECPDIILLDMQMPVMSGLEFLEHYQRRLPLSHPVSVFVLSANTDLSDADLERLQHLPIAGVLGKPLTPEQVEYMLRIHTQNRGPQQ